MKSSKTLYLGVGFIAGLIYVAACGGGAQSVAAAIGNAIDVVFNNGTSGLAATNVQSAVDEVAARLNAVQGQQIVGTWRATEYKEDATLDGLSLTLNADGSFTCTGDATSQTLNARVCGAPISWEVLKRSIRLIYTAPSSSGGGGAVTTTSSVVLPINFLGTSDMEILGGGQDLGIDVLVLSKSS